MKLCSSMLNITNTNNGAQQGDSAHHEFLATSMQKKELVGKKVGRGGSNRTPGLSSK